MNQKIKFKHISYRLGVGKFFLDESCFPTEDDLNDLEFNQAYTYWLTLIDMVTDPMVEQGWHTHHKHMISDREFGHRPGAPMIGY